MQVNARESSKSEGDRGKKIRLFMLLAAIGLSIKYIFVDFGIDAGFQTSMTYRFVTGDVMFREMWEPYQTSTFLCAPLVQLYLSLFQTTTGMVLYLQVIGVLLDGLVAYFLYRTVCRYFENRNLAFAMAWVFLLVAPKDVPLPEYANMQVWFAMLMCISLFHYYKNQKVRWIILAALSMCGIILSYISCLIVFVGVTLLLISRRDKRGTLIFVITCFVMGALYLCFIFSQVSLGELMEGIANMLSVETSHSVGLWDKCIYYAKDIAVIALVFACAYVVSYVTVKILGCTGKSEGNKLGEKILTDAIFMGIVLLVSLYSVIQWEKYVRYSYSLIFIAIILIGTRYAKRLTADKFCFYQYGTIISSLQFIATLILTNLQFMASVPYLLIAVIVAFLPISEAVREEMNTKVVLGIIKTVFVASALFLVFKSLYIIRPLNGDVNDITNIAGIVKSGPATGIVTEYMGAYMQNESYKEWEQYVQEGDAIFLIGDSLDTLGYMYSNTVISAPSLVPTPDYNESILKYWEVNPDKYPDVIIASCWYGAMNPILTEDSWIMKWIEEEYRPRSCIDGKYWRYYFK